MKEYENFLNMVKSIDEGSKIAVELHESPDPDAIATGFALYSILQKNNMLPTITHARLVSHPQNRSMRSKLHIPLSYYGGNKKSDFVEPVPGDFDYFILADNYGTKSQWFREGQIPVEKLLAIIDHHGIGETHPEAKLIDIRSVGSASTIAAQYLQQGAEELFNEDELKCLSTALYFGINNDTDNLLDSDNQLDTEMHAYLRPRVDKETLRSILKIKWKKRWLDLYGQSIAGRVTKSGITIADVGHIAEEDRDVIPMTADRLLDESGTTTVFVYGIRDEEIDVSIRAFGAEIDYEELRNIFPEGKCGGREIAGGMQIPNPFNMKSFINSSNGDRETIEKLIRKQFEGRLLPE